MFAAEREDASRFAILFWFYKDPEVTRNRFLGIRMKNPGTLIYGLYGGPATELENFKSTIALLDDCWLHPEVSNRWAWRNGDLMLARWWLERGRSLCWDQIFVHQWDLLSTVSLSDHFSLQSPHLEVAISGARPLDEVADTWVWVQEWSHYYHEFADFCDHPYITKKTLLACIFVFGVFGRGFWEEYAKVAFDIPGFVEYRLPTLTSALGYRILTPAEMPDWGDKGDRYLNGSGRQISREELAHLLSENLRPLIHPVSFKV